MNIVKQVCIILFASLIVVVLSLPLANSEWAEGFGDEGGEPSAGMAWVASFMKEAIFMGVPALITLGGSQINQTLAHKT